MKLIKKVTPRCLRLSDSNSIFKPKYKTESHLINVDIEELDEETNRIKYTTKYIVREPDDLKQYKVSDFYLDNLKISGAISELKQLSLSRDNLSAISHCTQTVTNIINSTIEQH